METKNKVWVVINDYLPTTITCRHDSYESADKEAKRLAKLHSDITFVVMESMNGYTVNNLVELKFVRPCDNPNDPDYIPF